MESTGAPGLLFCLPHPELGDFFLTGSALLETVGFDLIRLGTRKQPSGRPRIASRLSDHASTLIFFVRDRRQKFSGWTTARTCAGHSAPVLNERYAPG